MLGWLGDDRDRRPRERRRPTGPARTRAPGRDERGVVPQELLKKYQELKAEVARLEAARAACREEILGLLRGRAEVEPGPLAARLEKVTQIRFSARALAEAIGEEALEELEERVRPTEVTRLYVYERGSR